MPESSLVVAPKPGLHRHVAEFTYRAWDAVNQSTLWTFRKSAAHARYEFLNPLATPATDLGSAIHATLIEPDRLEERYAVRPPGIDRRTREGKAAWAEFLQESAGRTILEERSAWDTLRGIRDAVHAHPLAHELLTSRGETELSAVWDLDGTLCKGRMDRVVEYAGWTWVVDIKSTVDASPEGFARAATNYGYYLQAPFYLDGLDVLAPRERRFAIVACEKSPPYAIALYELDNLFLETGRVEYRRHLDTWRRCMETGEWPGYPAGIETLAAPVWLERRLIALEDAA